MRGTQIQIGGHRGLLRLRIAELDKDGICLDRRAWQHDDTFDGAVGESGDPADFIRYQHACTAHVAQHGPPLYRLDPQAAGLDSGRGRLESSEPYGRDDNNEGSDSTRNDAIALLALGDFGWSGDVHV